MPSNGGGYTLALAELAHNMQPGDAPAQVKHETLRILVDCLGCGVAGLATPGLQIAIDLARDEHGSLEATVIGGGTASLMPAAFANTVGINALDSTYTGPRGTWPPIEARGKTFEGGRDYHKLLDDDAGGKVPRQRLGHPERAGGPRSGAAVLGLGGVAQLPRADDPARGSARQLSPAWAPQRDNARKAEGGCREEPQQR